MKDTSTDTLIQTLKDYYSDITPLPAHTVKAIKLELKRRGIDLDQALAD